MTVTEQQHAQEISAAVARLAAINAQIAELTQQGNALKSFIRLALGPGTHAAGAMRVQITTRRLFSEDIAANVIPSNLLPLVTVTQSHISAKLAKEVLPAEMYDECCKPSEPAVKIT